MSLKIVVLVKQTLPTEAKIAMLPNGGVGSEMAKPIINPYDEFALEEAVKLVDQKKAAEVTIVSVGDASWQESLRKGLSYGAHKAVLIDRGTGDVDESMVARAIAAQIRAISPDLVLCGKVAVDSNAGEVPGRVAAELGMPLLHVASKLDVDGGKARIERSQDGTIVTMEAPLPCIVSADKSLNKPRTPTLPNIMAAKKKPLDTVPIASLLGGAGPTRKTVGYELPAARGPVKIVPGDARTAAKSLAGLLRDEAKVIR